MGAAYDILSTPDDQKTADPGEVPYIVHAELVRPVAQAITLLETVHDTLTFEVALDEAPALALGQQLTVRLTALGPRRTSMGQTEVRGILVRRQELSTTRSLRLRMADADTVTARMPPTLQALFNQRDAFRFEVDADQPVTVRVGRDWAGLRHRGHATDLSASGASVVVPIECEGALHGTTRIALEMVFPDSLRATRMEARIIRRELVDDQVRYGLRFDGDPYDFSRAGDAFVDYVMRRQREVQSGQRQAEQDAMRRRGWL